MHSTTFVARKPAQFTRKWSRLIHHARSARIDSRVLHCIRDAGAISGLNFRTGQAILFPVASRCSGDPLIMHPPVRTFLPAMLLALALSTQGGAAFGAVPVVVSDATANGSALPDNWLPQSVPDEGRRNLDERRAPDHYAWHQHRSPENVLGSGTTNYGAPPRVAGPTYPMTGPTFPMTGPTFPMTGPTFPSTGNSLTFPNSPDSAPQRPLIRSRPGHDWRGYQSGESRGDSH